MDITQPLSPEQRVANVLRAFVEAHPELADDAEKVIEDLAPPPVMSLYDVVREIGKHFFESAEGARAHAALELHEAEHKAAAAHVRDEPADVPAAPAPAPEGE